MYFSCTSDRVCAQLGVGNYTSGRSWCHNNQLSTGLGVSGCISDILSERHSEVVQQTRNHILQMSPPVVACHEALLLPQLPVVPWWVEFPSAEQVPPPVQVHTVQLHHNSYQIHCCHICLCKLYTTVIQCIRLPLLL